MFILVSCVCRLYVLKCVWYMSIILLVSSNTYRFLGQHFQNKFSHVHKKTPTCKFWCLVTTKGAYNLSENRRPSFWILNAYYSGQNKPFDVWFLHFISLQLNNDPILSNGNFNDKNSKFSYDSLAGYVLCKDLLCYL